MAKVRTGSEKEFFNFYIKTNEMISEKEIKHIAGLARIGMIEEEEETLRKDISRILDYFDLLKEANVSEMEPTSRIATIENVMRKDEARNESIELADKLIEAAPEKKGRYIKVRAVL